MPLDDKSDMRIVSQLAKPEHMSPYEMFYIACVPDELVDEFKKDRAQVLAVRKPEKRGFMNQTMSLKEHKKATEVEEQEKLEHEE